MKKITNMLAFLLLPFVICAQNFAPVGTIWIYEEFTTAWYWSSTVEATRGDTILGEYVTFVSGSRALAEDSMGLLDKGDKIYFYSKFNKQFNLLYDFTAEIGDTLVINGLSPDSVTGRCIITFIGMKYDSTCDDGIIRKRWKIDNIYEDENGHSIDYELSGDIIEGIGCVQSQGLFPVYGLANENGAIDIRCYNNGITNCKWVDYPCDTSWVISTKDLSKEDVDIKINCQNGQCALDYSMATSGRYFFILYNAGGQEIVRKNLDNPSGTTSWNTSSSGIHLWRIYDTQGRQLSGKLMID